MSLSPEGGKRLAGFTFVVALPVYVSTMARTVTWADSGEMILAPATLGVLHPPGFPTYVLFAHVFTWLPFGTLAERVTLFSSVAAAAAAGMLTWIAVELERTRARARTSTAPERWFPIVAGLTFAFGVTPWRYAVVAEVYALTAALVCASVLCLLRAGQSGRGMPAAMAGWFFGLALGSHHATTLMTLPLLVVLAWRLPPGRRSWLLPGLGTGLLVYLHLPLRSGAGLPAGWGDLSTWEGFLRHVSAAGFWRALGPVSAAQLDLELQTLWTVAFEQFTPAGLVLAVAGLAILARRDPALGGALGVIVAADVLFSLHYRIPTDKEAYYLPLGFVLILGIAVAAAEMAARAAGRAAAVRIAAGAILALLPVANLVTHWSENDHRQNRTAPEYVENVLRSVPHGGMLLAFRNDFNFPFEYMREIEGFRRDATVVLVSAAIHRREYLRTVLPSIAPELAAACAEEREALERARGEETFRARTLDFVRAAIGVGLETGTVHVLPPLPWELRGEYHAVPVGLTYRLSREPLGIVEGSPPRLESLLDETVPVGEVLRGSVLRVHLQMIEERAAYLRSIGRTGEAHEHMELSRRVRARTGS